MLAAEAAGKDVLNLFAYTCGAGVAALAAGASSVVNVDHSAAYLAVGRRNTALNASKWEGRPPVVQYIAQDFYTAARQMAGLGVAGRASRGRRNATFPKLAPRDFDLVVLDPPTFTKSAFGAVDIVNDYPALAKPSLLCTRPGGMLVATNHAPQYAPCPFSPSPQQAGVVVGVPSHLQHMSLSDDMPRGKSTMIRNIPVLPVQRAVNLMGVYVRK